MYPWNPLLVLWQTLPKLLQLSTTPTLDTSTPFSFTCEPPPHLIWTARTTILSKHSPTFAPIICPSSASLLRFWFRNTSTIPKRWSRRLSSPLWHARLPSCTCSRRRGYQTKLVDSASPLRQRPQANLSYSNRLIGCTQLCGYSVVLFPRIRLAGTLQ